MNNYPQMNYRIQNSDGDRLKYNRLKYNLLDDDVPDSVSIGNCGPTSKFFANETTNLGIVVPSPENIKTIASNPGPVRKGKQYDITNLNNQTYKAATDFYSVDCANPSDCNSNRTYVAFDQRLFDPIRNIVTKLDSIPYDGEITMDQVYDPKYVRKGYGKGYETYSDIDAGQILYYNDATIANPYFNPNFIIPNNTYTQLMRTPMGSIEPQYYNVNTQKSLRNLGCNRWVQDSLFNREDLMSRQMSLMNKQNWSARWGQN
jgi:hypothetical protein